MLLLETRVVKRLRRNQRGITLVEYVIAVAISALLVMVLVPFSLYTARTLASLANYADMNTSSLRAVDRLTTDIRRAARVEEFKNNKLKLEFLKGDPVEYEFNPTDGKFTRKEKKGGKEVLMTDCKTLSFSMFQRTPVTGTYDQYAAATNTDTKVIAMNWSTARKLLGSRSNQDQLQTAKVVIRSR